MKTHYSISIPKPCHEDWPTMTPNEKGRFCQSCSKTVVDFTRMKQDSIEDYLAINRNKKICGRFNVSQLEQIKIEIPQQIIQQHMSFHKLFLLALLITMGTSLLSCSDQDGNTKKIDIVEIVDTLKPLGIDIPEASIPVANIDSILNNVNTKILEPIKTKEAPTPLLKGLIVEVMGDMKVESAVAIDEIVFGFIHVDYSPEFLDTPKTILESEKKEYFSKRISKFVSENFDLSQGDYDLKGKQRIKTQFTIDKDGNIKDIKTRATHIHFEKEARRVINLLPKFKPGQQGGKNVEVVYTLPIVFMAED